MTRKLSTVLLLLGVGLFTVGITAAAVTPFRGILAISALGMSNERFAFVLTVASIAAAIGSVLMGYVSDRVRDRRLLVFGSALSGAVAYLLIFFVHSQLAFVIAMWVFLPFGAAVLSQLLSYARAYVNQHYGPRAEFIMAILRSLFSAAWVITPPLMGFLAEQRSVFTVFLVAAMGQVGAALLMLVLLRRSDAAVARSVRRPVAVEEPTSSLSTGIAMLPLPKAVGLTGVMLSRIAITSHMACFPLFVIHDVNGTYAELGIASAFAALLEIPLMIFWGHISARVRKERVIILNSLIYALYLFLLGFATNIEQVYGLQVLCALAIGGLVSTTISYTQEAIVDQVGLSTSLLDVMTLIGGFATAAVLAIFANENHYAHAEIATGGFALFGAVLLYLGSKHSTPRQ